jgi:hypothetical protein
MMNLKSIPSHSPSVVTRKTGNEYVLVPVTNNIADMDSVYTLNETGAFIWEHIDGNRSLESIIEILISEYDTDTETAKSDLLDFINKMNEYLIIR